MIAPARQAAYDVLRAVSAGRADLPTALARARTRLTDDRDRALAGEIATGTLRWQGAFDRVIAEFARRPTLELDPEVLDLLRMTAFQLLHLDRVPASAAVNDAVDLTRKIGKKSAAPLVNAVLRRISRERDRLPLPHRPLEWVKQRPGSDPGDPGVRPQALDYLSVTLSHPRWLSARWLDAYGLDNAEAWEQFDNTPAALTLRANTLRTTRDALSAALAAYDVVTEATRFAPDGLVVRSGNPLLTPLASQGLCVVQDEASQLVAIVTGARPGDHVLDVCASPGGKTTAMAASMRDRGLIVASDVRGRRVDLLARAVRASGAICVRIVQADAGATLPFRHEFDRVLIDAPCSGLGTLRRDPDIRWRRTESELPALAAAQLAMAERAAAAVRPGGRLVYSTCSSEPEENEQVIASFLTRHPEFSVAAPERFPALVRPFLTADGHFRTYPFRDGLEAFFAAILVKTKDLR
jgi:16S rRNA (cytosine967-C5)-methyltransferase